MRTRLVGIVGLGLIAAAGPGAGQAGSGTPATSAERIVFSSTRGASDGSAHLWMIDPGGDPASLVQITLGPFRDGAPSVSPDGRLVAFARAPVAETLGQEIWVRSLVTGSERRLAGDYRRDSDDKPFWHRDGTMLGFDRDRREAGEGRRAPATAVWVVPLDTSAGSVAVPGTPRRLSREDGIPRFAGSWNPATGADIVFLKKVGGLHPFTVWRMEYPGGAETEVIPHLCCGAFHPSYSPDGRRIAYVSYRHDHAGDVYVAEADGSRPTRVTCESGWTVPDWSPDGTELVAQRTIGISSLWRIAVPPPGGKCSAAPVRITPDGVRANTPTWAVVQLPPTTGAPRR